MGTYHREKRRRAVYRSTCCCALFQLFILLTACVMFWTNLWVLFSSSFSSTGKKMEGNSWQLGKIEPKKYGEHTGENIVSVRTTLDNKQRPHRRNSRYWLPPLYVRQHCNRTGELDNNNDDRRDTEEEENWRFRTPSFFILGVKKGGTTGLFHTLIRNHPHIIRGRTKELQFFIPKRFSHWTIKPSDNMSHPNYTGSSKIMVPHHDDDGHAVVMVQVASARRELYKKHFPLEATMRKNKQWITGEATPDYLMFPDYAAPAIFCTVPWVNKFIVLLRDPIDRLFSHYNYLKDPNHGIHRNNLPDFEEWVRNDIQVLQQVGVLPHNLSDLPTYMKSPAERQGWLKYQRLVRPGRAGSDRQVCRSLYAPQLEAWQGQLHRAGKDFNQHVKILWSRDLLGESDNHGGKTTTTTTMEILRDLVSWLGLDPNLLKIQPTTVFNDANNNNTTTTVFHRSMITHYSSPPIRPEFRQWLQINLFNHFNQRLYDFLGPQYQGIFDDRPKT